MLRHFLRVWVSSSLGLVMAAALVPARVAETKAAADDTRGLWVLRSSLSSARSIQQMVETARRAGINTLLVQVRGRGDAYYDSRIDPRAAELEDEPASFDPLAVTLTTAHAAGLKVHAWVNVNLVASATLLPRAPSHIISRHPEWLMVPRSLASVMRSASPGTPAYVGQIARAVRAQSDQVEGLYLSPILPAAREYTASVIRGQSLRPRRHPLRLPPVSLRAV